jgi:DivIVA domain-containing protein
MTEGRLAPEEVRTRTFSRVVRGYKRREVRRLLERAAADLDRLRNDPTTSAPDDEPPLTPEAVEEARFQPALGGYEMGEVDEFLDRVVAELERSSREPVRAPSALPPPPRVGLFPPPVRGIRVAHERGAELEGEAVEAEIESEEAVRSTPDRAEAEARADIEPPVGREAEPEVATGVERRDAVAGVGAGVEPAPGRGRTPPPGRERTPPPPGREGTSPAPDPDAALAADQWMHPGARTEPPLAGRQLPAAGPLPASPGRAGAGPLPAAPPPPAEVAPPRPEPRPEVPPPAEEAAPAPPPAGPVDEEGFFPPPTVPPSAAPAQTPPPPPPSATRPPSVQPARPLTPSEVETRSFDRGAPGYLPNHVDLFLAKAARALAGRDGETLTRWDVLRQRFPLGPRGYATNEVDAFLVRLAAQFPDPDPAAQEEILRKLLRADGP